jgi:hypothetical protein
MRCVHKWERDKARGARYRCSKCGAFGHRKKWNQGPVHRYKCSGCHGPANLRSWSGLYERWWCADCAPPDAAAPVVA